MDAPTASVIVAGIAAIASVIGAYLINKKGREMTAAVQEVHVSLNSRLSELLRITAESSKAEGAEEERLRRES